MSSGNIVDSAAYLRISLWEPTFHAAAAEADRDGPIDIVAQRA